MATLVLTIKTSKDPSVFKQASQDRENLNQLINLLSGVNIGAVQATVDVQSASADPVAATSTATLTYGSLVNNTDTVVMFGVTLTCVTGTPAASDATTGQFKKQTDATVSAANLVTTVNAHTTLAKYVAATSAAGVVTFTLKNKGLVGNFIKDNTSAGTGIAWVQWANGAGGVTDTAVSIAR